MSDYEYVVRVTGARSREGFGESYYAARGADWGLFGEGRDDLRLLTVTGSRADVEALLDEDEAVAEYAAVTAGDYEAAVAAVRA